MSGKILAAICFGMLSLLLILAAFKVCFAIAPGPLRLVNLSWPVLLQLLTVLLPMVLISTTLLTLISASVKTVKEAQSYMSVLMLLPIIPTVMLMVNPMKNQLWQFAVPFLAQNQLILRLVRSEAITIQEWAVYLAASFSLGLVLWVLAARSAGVASKGSRDCRSRSPAVTSITKYAPPMKLLKISKYGRNASSMPRRDSGVATSRHATRTGCSTSGLIPRSRLRSAASVPLYCSMAPRTRSTGICESCRELS